MVVGAGAAGGLAAERLTQAGLKILLLDAGFQPALLRAPFRRLLANTISRLANPDLLPLLPPGIVFNVRRAFRIAGRIRQPVQSSCYAWERQPDAFVDDWDCPYTTEQPFKWIRARALQGRVGIPGHGRMYLRFGRDDFAPTDGESPPWPFAREEIEPWYRDVEKRLSISGALDNLPWLPDCEIANNLVPTQAESAFMNAVKIRWPGAHPVLGRYAPPADTLDGAACTGRLGLRRGAIVRAIEVKRNRVIGVRWHDQISGSECSVHVPIVFLCASALESTRILMLSEDCNGRSIGAESNALGHYLMDHVMLKAEGIGAALPGTQPTRIEDGRCVYLPRFDARESDSPNPGRGFGVQVYRGSLGQDRSFFFAVSFAEMRPRMENRVSLNRRRVVACTS
jgi:choline dehydrogenase-like flavoprotein